MRWDGVDLWVGWSIEHLTVLKTITTYMNSFRPNMLNKGYLPSRLNQRRPSQTWPNPIIASNANLRRKESPTSVCKNDGIQIWSSWSMWKFQISDSRFHHLGQCENFNHNFSMIISMWKFQGLFSRITFSQPVYLGGKGSIRNVKHFLQMEQGVSFSSFFLLIMKLWRFS